jgi:AMMECR1 domain-containing protein
MGKTLQQYSLAAAMKDHRFNPIVLGELPKLSVEIAVLENIESVDNTLDWEVGKHGLEIEFT